MKVITLIFASIALTLAEPAEICSSDVCTIDDGCRCPTDTSPIGNSETPQLITLVFTDAVTDAIYNDYLNPLLVGRTNPDGVQVGATFYVPHEYTDYERVNQLFNVGLDIGVHSISKNPLSDYWKDADEDTLVDEFYGQREILNAFGNIPMADVVGARTPGFQIAGDVSFRAYQRAEIQFDNSWVFRSENMIYPFSLHYGSHQTCQVGECPTESHPDTWVIPVIDIVGTNGAECNALLGCVLEAESVNDVKSWLMAQFERHYSSNRAPITLTVNAAWFEVSEFNYPGLVAFLDELKNNYSDAFLVDHKQVFDWIKNPVPISQFVTKTTAKEAPCNPVVCVLDKGEEKRYMKTCTFCPDVFPWVGNSLGEA